MPLKHIPRLAVAVDTLCREVVWQPPGVAVGLCDRNGLRWSRCLGRRQLGRDATVDEHTVFALASGTKTLAAASISHLCRATSLHWDSRVVDIDPTFDAGSETVTRFLTLRDLACNRTGWTSSEGRHRGAALTRADLVSRLRHHGFRHGFRETFAYCTDGFSLLGHLVDIASTRPWEQYVHTHLLAPLGMQRTSFSVAEAQASGNAVSPHVTLDGGQRVAVPWRYEDLVATPAGGANSCLHDMSSWLSAWLRGGGTSSWSAEQTAEMLTPQIADAGPFADHELTCAVGTGADGITDEAYALGWYTHRYRGEPIYHHTGSIRGFRSMLALLPARGIGFMAFVNADDVYLPRALFQATVDLLQGSDPLQWTNRFAELERAWHLTNAGHFHLAAETGAAVADGDLQGEYFDDGRFGRVRVVDIDGTLLLHAGALRYRIVPAGDTVADVYRCEEPLGPLLANQGVLRVRRDAAGRVGGFEYQGGIFHRL